MQRTAFDEQLRKIDKNKCVLILDYTRFHESTSVKISDLGFTIYFKDTNENLHYEPFDIFSNVKKFYLLTTLSLILRKFRMDDVCIIGAMCRGTIF
jgi:hypothetical protein